jgi:hypothetical protein
MSILTKQERMEWLAKESGAGAFQAHLSLLREGQPTHPPYYFIKVALIRAVLSWYDSP